MAALRWMVFLFALHIGVTANTVISPERIMGTYNHLACFTCTTPLLEVHWMMDGEAMRGNSNREDGTTVATICFNIIKSTTITCYGETTSPTGSGSETDIGYVILIDEDPTVVSEATVPTDSVPTDSPTIVTTVATDTDTDDSAYCGAPPPPVSGSLLQPDTNTTEGSVMVFQCDPRFVPEGEMTAVCESDGQWTPNPGDVTCSPTPTQPITQTFPRASIPTPTSTPASSSPTPQPWVVPVVVVCVCVLVIACVVIIIVGIVIVRRRQSRGAKKSDASSDHLELQPPTMGTISEPSRSQVPGRLMYADLGPHTPVRPPSTADDVQYSSLLHGEAVETPLDPADDVSNDTAAPVVESGLPKLPSHVLHPSPEIKEEKEEENASRITEAGEDCSDSPPQCNPRQEEVGPPPMQQPNLDKLPPSSMQAPASNQWESSGKDLEAKRQLTGDEPSVKTPVTFVAPSLPPQRIPPHLSVQREGGSQDGPVGQTQAQLFRGDSGEQNLQQIGIP